MIDDVKYFNYFILYSTDKEVSLEYDVVNQFPISSDKMSILSSNAYCNTTHLWDKEADSIIPALFYIMQLPRTTADIEVQDIDFVLRSHDEAHNIIVFPFPKDIKFSPVINPVENDGIRTVFGIIKCVKPSLIICTDDIFEAVSQCFKDIPFLGIVKVSDLNTALLHQHWQQLCDSLPEVADIKTLASSFQLLFAPNGKILPLLPLAKQTGFMDYVLNNVQELSEGNEANKFLLYMRHELLNYYNDIAQKNAEFKQRNESVVIESQLFNGTPLVISLPGIVNQQKKMFGRTLQIPQNEKDIINILGYHRAIAKIALYISLDTINQSMFQLLDQLENHCKDTGKIKNSYVWRILNKIGLSLNQALQASELDIVKTISQITVFSDFPIGLAILPETSAPLCCFKSISYRPLTPLTRAFQCEITKFPQIYMGRGKILGILFIECVDAGDRIRSHCDVFKKELDALVKSHGEAVLFIEEAHSVDDFKNLLNKYKGIDILVVSAHGSYNPDNNVASLIIGKEHWLATDNDIRVPPLVLLSACHVMPRGHGAVTVGDVFLRAGALAVLGTFIPVDVIRNAKLLLRFFINFFQVRDGWSHMRTLDEVWCHTVGSHAIHEILDSSEKLSKWAITKMSDGTFPEKEFKRLAANEVRRIHVYDDTEKLLRNIAERYGMRKYFDSLVQGKNYFPESVFYQFIGAPENIFVRNPIMYDYVKNLSLTNN